MKYNLVKKLVRYLAFVALSFVLANIAFAEEDIPYLLTVSGKGDLVTVRALLEGGTLSLIHI